MKKMLFVLAAFNLLTACAGPKGDPGIQGPVGNTGPQGPSAPTPTPSPTPSPVEVVVQEYNDTREAQGYERVIPGLNCVLSTVPTTATQLAGASLTTVGGFEYRGVFNEANTSVNNGLNVLPAPLKNLYKTWFVLKCSGYIVVADNKWHQFDLTSDDGAILYVDGAALNNDGMHSVQTKSSAKFLSRGVHTFELDFLQGAGMEALVLNMDGSVLPASRFYH
jgi:hypothetical protein